MRGWRVRIAVFLALLATGAFAQDFLEAPAPVTLSDSALIVWLGGDRVDAHWQLVPALDTTGEGVLLRNGSEYARVPEPKFSRLLGANQGMFEARETAPALHYRPALSRQEAVADWLDFSLSLDNPRFALPTGVRIGYGGASVAGGRPFMEDRWTVGVAARVSEVHAEVEVARVEEYMNLQRAVRRLYGSEEFGGTRVSLSLALPLLRYTARVENGALPKYYWLDSGVVDLYQGASTGSGESNAVLSQFENGMEGHSTNLSHELELRWWALRYRLLLDGDVYTGPVHWVGVSGLPMGIGSWGAHVVWCGPRLASGMELELGPYDLFMRKGKSRTQTLRWSPLRVEFEYADWERLRFAASSTVSIDGLWGREEP